MNKQMQGLADGGCTLHPEELLQFTQGALADWNSCLEQPAESQAAGVGFTYKDACTIKNSRMMGKASLSGSSEDHVSTALHQQGRCLVLLARNQVIALLNTRGSG